MVQQDFGIALSRTVNVLASTGVQLFIPSVMAYGRDAAGNYQGLFALNLCGHGLTVCTVTPSTLL